MQKRSNVSVAAPLTPEQQQTLDALLRNESDMAYKRRVRRMVAYLELAPGLSVLDCGCGMGFYLKVLAALYPSCRLWGLEYEPKVLRYAHDHLALAGVTLVRGDIHHLPFAAESLDRVLLSEVLEHLEDDAAALREVWRVLKPGGLLALTVPPRNYSFWFDPLNWLREHLGLPPIRQGPCAGIWANHRRLYTTEALRRVVEGAGFTIQRYEELTHYCFPATQFLVYTIGKGLVERNLLPEFLSRSADRFRGPEHSFSPLNPMNWALALFERIDRLNEDPQRMAAKRTFINLAIQARKV